MINPVHAAIHAAKMVPTWGAYAAARYARAHGAPLITWITALKFEQRRRIRNGVAA